MSLVIFLKSNPPNVPNLYYKYFTREKNILGIIKASKGQINTSKYTRLSLTAFVC